MVWSYSAQHYEQPTIRRLAERFLEAFRMLISHCLTPDAGGYTPSDFPLAQLSQSTLSRLLADIEFEPWTEPCE